MTESTPPRSPLRLEGIFALLPASEGLRPLFDHLLGSSRPDPDRRWTVGGELGTAGARLVEVEGLGGVVTDLVRAQTERAERRLRSAVAVLTAAAAGDGEGVVDALLEEAQALEGEGAMEEARDWAESAVREGMSRGSPRTGEALRRAGRCARGMGDLEAARSLYEEAHLRSLDLGRPADAVIAATGRGNVAVDQGRWAEAENWYRQGLSLVPDEDRGLRWRLFQNLGITHRERGDFGEAGEWYRRAAAEAATEGDPAATVEVENGWGQLELARGAPRAAELRFRRALAALEAAGGGEGRVAVRVNLGEALLRQGRTLEAGEMGREAEAEALRSGFLRRLPEIYRLLAQVAHVRGEPEAFVFLDRALALVRERRLPPYEEALTLDALAGLREAGGEVEAAADARQLAEEILRRLGIRRAPPGVPEGRTEEEGDEP